MSTSNDGYYIDADSALNTAHKMKGLIDDYNQKIHEIETLIKEIATSSAWQDAEIKTAFINTVNSYHQTFKDTAENMARLYNNYLNNKLNSELKHESDYS